MGEALIRAALGTVAIMCALALIVMTSQVIARGRWRRQARPKPGSAPRWNGHLESRQAEALWNTGPAPWLGWFWRGLYPVTLRARPDGLVVSPRGALFSALSHHPSAVIPWADLTRGNERRLGRASIELGPSAVPLTRVSLGVTGATAATLLRRPNPSPTYIRFVTPVPAGLALTLNQATLNRATLN